jgi:hypothetical protein
MHAARLRTAKIPQPAIDMKWVDQQFARQASLELIPMPGSFVKQKVNGDNVRK